MFKEPDQHPVLPGYLSEEAARPLRKKPIGFVRLLTVGEEANLLALGLTRDKAGHLTPEELDDMGNAVSDTSGLFVGS